jgi:hypothetical protein
MRPDSSSSGTKREADLESNNSPNKKQGMQIFTLTESNMLILIMITN